MIKFLRWLPALAVVANIYYLSDIPNLHIVSDGPLRAKIIEVIGIHTIKIGRDGFFSYVFSTDPDWIAHKIGHVVFFGLLGAALYYALRKPPIAVAIAIVVAIGDELHQYFVIGRSSRFGDIVLDSIAAIGAIIVIHRAFARRRGQA